MLKQRVITAIILTAVFLSALFGLSLTHFALFIGAVVLVGAWEWANLSSFGALGQRIAYAILLHSFWQERRVQRVCFQRAKCLIRL